MSEIIKHFLTAHGRLVVITQRPSAFGDKKMLYEPNWLPDFMLCMTLDLSRGYNFHSIEDTIRALQEWDPKLQPIDDLGDFPLYQVEMWGKTYITDKPDETLHTSIQSILAKNVPNGARLYGNAKWFFKYWKGADAVNMQRNILLK